MKRAVKHITSWFLLVVLFISTTGFTVYSHFCTMQEEMNTMTGPDVPSCCSAPASISATHQDARTKNIVNCCETNASFIKLHFTAHQQKQLEISNILVIQIADILQTPTFSTGSFAIESSLLDLPPPLTGREILLQQDMLRI